MARVAQRTRRPLLPLCVASLIMGCVSLWGPVEVDEPAEPAGLSEQLDGDLDSAIDQAMPSVSYRSKNPAMNDPLGREDPTVILPRIETLDGDRKIVCLKTERHVFGRCAFPAPAAP